MKKRPLILLEIMIALSLTALLLTTLARFFAGCLKMDQKIEQLRSSLAGRQKVQVCLSSIFTSMAPLPGSAALCTLDDEGTSLGLSFDNGIDPDPKFSGQVIGKLFVDESSNLCLAIWPIDEEATFCRKEILCPNVQKMNLKFFAKKKAASPSFGFEWRSTWPKESGALPPMVRLSLTQRGETSDFAFAIPCKGSRIPYRIPRGAQ